MPLSFTVFDKKDGTGLTGNLSGVVGDTDIYAQVKPKGDPVLLETRNADGAFDIPLDSGRYFLWAIDADGIPSLITDRVTNSDDCFYWRLLERMASEIAELELPGIGDNVEILEFPNAMSNVEQPAAIITTNGVFSADQFDTCGRMNIPYPTYLVLTDRADANNRDDMYRHIQWVDLVMNNIFGRRPADDPEIRAQMRFWELIPSNIAEDIKRAYDLVKCVFPFSARTHRERF